MTRRQFRVLYREFLLRTVDLELLSAQGDVSKLLGQFAALLILMGLVFSLSIVGLGDNRTPRTTLLINAWGIEHVLIATTMLVVGLFAVLSWNSIFPDRRDVLVLGPLPVQARTIFAAKVAATATALAVTVFSLNVFTSVALSLALAPASSSLLDLILSPGRYRLFVAYWLTMLAAGAFIFCCVLAVQGVSAQLLPRRRFLKLSAFLQMAAFCLFVSTYFLQPSLASPSALGALGNQALLAWLPSYWFLGLFQQLNGSMHPAMIPLAERAFLGLGVALTMTAVTYMLSYFRTLRKIVEEPDILPGSHSLHWSPQFGDSLATAIVQFSIRTLLRSRQHRVTLAFYLGIGFAVVILFMRTPRAQEMLRSANLPLIFSSLVMMCTCVIGMRVVFAMPLELKANWIFRITEVRPVREYLTAIRRPLFVIAVAPIWLISTALFLALWPWRAAVGHLVLLGLWGIILAWISLHGFQKIPFTCSWLPGKSLVHMAFLAAIGLLFLIRQGAVYELHALQDVASYVRLLAALSIVAVLARWRTVLRAGSEEAIVQFEEVPPPAVLELGLNRFPS